LINDFFLITYESVKNNTIEIEIIMYKIFTIKTSIFSFSSAISKDFTSISSIVIGLVGV
jgi:hypothetical protein